MKTLSELELTAQQAEKFSLRGLPGSTVRNATDMDLQASIILHVQNVVIGEER